MPAVNRIGPVARQRAGCGSGDTGTDDARDAGAVGCAEPGQWGDCELPGHDDRGYDVYVPTRAESEGFAVVYPNGTGYLPLRRLRTWNAGGGGEYDCTSGRACHQDVDDVAYIDALLDDVESWLDIDTRRVWVVGHSNGAAMSHRLACELSDRIAAIAAVGGTNQFAATAPCEPAAPVAIMQVHGTEDSCWSYEPSDRSCAGLPFGGYKVGVDESTDAWVDRLACSDEATTTQLPDVVDDGITTDRTTWAGCDGAVEVTLLRIDGGGHTWPGGDASGPEWLIGETTQDWDSTVLVEFLARFTR
jgi:polyhydroxybutyrate depolymerase